MFRIITEGLDYKEHVLLKDGQGILLKPATPADFPLIKSFMKRVSRESLHMRFMAAVSEVSDDLIKNLCTGDFRESGCLLAITGEGENERVVGVGNYTATGNGRSAEIAFLIEDDFQGKGISTLLLERLAGLAAANGIIELEAEVLPDNQPMINVFKSSGFTVHQVWSSDTIHIELPVGSAAALWKKAELRERIAVANSLSPILNPKTVAVIGASRDQNSIGNIIFRNILNGGFTGTLYPVNPEAISINGVKAYSKISELPEKIDLAVVSVPAEKVIPAVEEAIKAGTKGFVIVSAGFAEIGEEGKKRQQQLVELIQANGVRLVGPSCLGVMNTNPQILLNASLAPEMAPRGPAGFFSHSAALGLVILEYATEHGLGFTYFVSAGNRADVTGNDLLQYWEEDPDTKMAIMYLESFKNPRKFVRVARRMSYKKPVLCVKSGRSREGKKATEKRSGIPGAGDVEVEALFEQTGVILAETLEDLFDIALVLAHQPLPKGNKVSIIANSAGMATIFADSCEANGLDIAGPGLVNLGAFTSPENYEKTVFEALINDNVDALLIGYACVGNCTTQPFAKAIRNGVKKAEETTKVQKPVLLCLMGEVGSVSLIEEDDEKRMFPAFRFPEAAPKALGKIVKYVNFKNVPHGEMVWFEDIKAEESRKLVLQIIESNSGKDEIIQVKPSDAVKILKNFNLDIALTVKDVAERAEVKVKTDSLFGPLIECRKNSKSVLRITPLTDRDINEIIKDLNINNSNKMKEILGKISQLIEEIPWLWSLKITVFCKGQIAISPEVKMELKTSGIKRPSY